MKESGFTGLFDTLDGDGVLTDFLSGILEQEAGKSERDSINAYVKSLMETDVKTALQLDATVAALVGLAGSIYFAAGFLFGQSHDVHDPEVSAELHEFKKRMQAVFGVWPRDNNNNGLFPKLPA